MTILPGAQFEILLDGTGMSRLFVEHCEAVAAKNNIVLRPGFETPGWAYSGGQL